MPLYEYECDACQHRFELIQKFSDAAPDTCPSCGAGSVRKLLSSPAIQFKGTGWYITDYARKDSGRPSGKTEGGAESKSSSEAGSAGDAKGGDSKPASGTAASPPAATTSSKES